MRSPLADRLSAAGNSGNPERVRQAAEEFRALLAAGDPEAVELYRDAQRDMLPDDPLADGACEWPAELSESTAVINVPESEPILGWRMWTVRGSRLLAPFQITQRKSRTLPGMAWCRGINATTTNWCQEGSLAKLHPRPWNAGCVCGIRAVQSRTLIDAFAAQMATRTPPVLGDAVAQVAVWGNVAGYRADDDWEYTLRAQYARIVGRLEVTAEHQAQASALERRYGVEVRVA